MSLRKQLLAFGLLTLVLPWAGYRVVQEMEGALRGGLEQALLASAGTVASALDAVPVAPATGVDGADTDTDRAELLPGNVLGAAVYAPPLATDPVIDGLRSDWPGPPDPGTALPGGGRYWAGIHGRYLYLYVAAADQDLVYEGPPGETPYGDRLVVATGTGPAALQWLLFATRAPGTFRGQYTMPPAFAPSGTYEPRVIAAWQERSDGFDVEVRIPLTLVGRRLGIALIDVDRKAAAYQVAMTATWNAPAGVPGVLVRQSRGLAARLQQFARAGSRFRVVNAEGWVLAGAGEIVRTEARSAAPGLGDRLFSAMLQRHDPPYARLEPRPGRLAGAPVDAALKGQGATAWYSGGPGNSTVVAAAAPIQERGQVVGAVLLEQTSDPILTLANRALLRLMSLTLLAAAIAALGLFGYATFLSVRVRRLARAAETALGPRGELDVRLPGRSAGDEIGDLARSFGRLLERLGEHTQYLRTLASKLSHELRTPLAVVATSLDNLEHEVHDAAAQPYLKRLRYGTLRLDAILAAMSEATRLEQAIQDTEPERFDLSLVVDACCKAYVDVYPSRRFVWQVADGAEVFGSAELVAQLVDKLVDNAVGFSPEASTLELEVRQVERELCLAVRNRGPILPAAMQGSLFDSLVSIRGHDDGAAHLGLGLHIVALVAEFHRGRAAASNLADGSGVEFRVWFPRA